MRLKRHMFYVFALMFRAFSQPLYHDFVDFSQCIRIDLLYVHIIAALYCFLTFQTTCITDCGQ